MDAIPDDRIRRGGTVDEDADLGRVAHVVPRHEVAERPAGEPDADRLAAHPVAGHAVVAGAVDRDADAAVVPHDVADDEIAVRRPVAELAVVEHDVVPAVVLRLRLVQVGKSALS